MKTIVSVAVISICLIFTVCLIMTVNNYMVRKNEVEEDLSVAMDAAMDAIKYNEDGYAITDYEQLISDLNQNILLQLTSNSDVTIKILYVDLDNGILDVEVVQKYKWANTDKEVSVRRTVMLEEYVDETAVEEIKTCTVTFEVGSEVYTTVTVNYGDVLSKPSNPTVEGYTFEGWYVAGDTVDNVITDAEWNDFYVA
jgi:uncharacterized repeat protein (TIGR02543 family)